MKVMHILYNNIIIITCTYTKQCDKTMNTSAWMYVGQKFGKLLALFSAYTDGCVCMSH